MHTTNGWISDFIREAKRRKNLLNTPSPPERTEHRANADYKCLTIWKIRNLHEFHWRTPSWGMWPVNAQMKVWWSRKVQKCIYHNPQRNEAIENANLVPVRTYQAFLTELDHQKMQSSFQLEMRCLCYTQWPVAKISSEALRVMYVLVRVRSTVQLHILNRNRNVI